MTDHYELNEAPDKLRLLAEWLSITDRPGQGKAVQQDLKTWANDIGGLLAERQQLLKDHEITAVVKNIEINRLQQDLDAAKGTAASATYTIGSLREQLQQVEQERDAIAVLLDRTQLEVWAQQQQLRSSEVKVSAYAGDVFDLEEKLRLLGVVADNRSQVIDEVRQQLQAKGGAVCPCTLTEPCGPNCTCAHPGLSGGCSRCATYGSAEQRLAAAKGIVAKEEENRRLREAVQETIDAWDSIDRGYDVMQALRQALEENDATPGS